MARRRRRPGTSCAVTATVPTVATHRTRRRCRNIPPTLSAVPIRESPTPPATPSSDHGSSFVCDEDLETVAHLSSDTDTNSAANAETDSSRDSGIDLHREWEGERDTPPASEADAILKRIAYHQKQGPAKPRHSDKTKELWKTESKFWKSYCLMVQEETGLSPKNQLRRCDPAVFKTYLEWRTEHSQIKKESAIDAYWKRLSMYYDHVVGHAMANKVLKDVRRWIPELELDRSKKEKLAMYVQDLFAILHALWVDDKKPLHGFIRVQISALLLLSAATATRPGALVESASNKGSNKALCFKDVSLMKVHILTDPNRSVLMANVNLVHVKNKERDGTSKKFTFHLEGLPAYCIVSHLLAIGFRQDAFHDGFSTIQQIFDLKIPAEREVLRIRWKEDLLDKPFFCNVQSTVEGGRALLPIAFPYWKYREIFVRLGRIAGFEENVELYQLRRASGDRINEALPTTSRNQTMGHSSETYERYYTPTHIARDFQSIYFGTPSQEDLIRSVARMGLSRDRRAPVELDDKQQEEVRNHPLLVELREERDVYKHKLYSQGFRPLVQAQGTSLYADYESTNRRIGSTTEKLRRERLKKAIQKFHDSIDAIEIEKQLSGKPATEILTLPMPEFELRERATVANMLSKPFKNDRARVQHIHNLARLCRLQETPRPKARKRKVDCVEDSTSSSKADDPRTKRTRLEIRFERGEPTASKGEGDTDALHHLYPMIPPHPVCLLCIGRGSYEWRMRPIPRKDVLKKHIKVHFKDPQYQCEFECRHPSCSEKLDGIGHFMRHALDVHGVCH
ncbi:hypothetical protein PMIN01_11828 [Paraphaeosphaeria minitans]|uniref:C2H2-type domain-containing protein n=1 Tax=Paraphaeosphaeria minitans TaxID=565426 RepID=A0A9P6KKL3_9PLEO|nr:hypothetical protein PMIN01_11828 [Paraphaeosphaeria minitans]